MQVEHGEYVDCPYNKAHRILSFRLAGHLVKCRKNYPDVEKVKCPFNSTHIVAKPELNVSGIKCTPKRKYIL